MSRLEKAVALVLGAQHPTGLMTARALRDCGVKIVGLAYSDSPCLRSSVWSTILTTERTTQMVLRAIWHTATETEKYPLLLLPADDESVKILSDQRHALPASCVLSMPDAPTVDLLLDKSQFYPWAEKQGFSSPVTIEVSNFEELDSAITKIGYPLLIKPMYRTARWDQEYPNFKIFILNHSGQCSDIPKNIFNVTSVLLAQQWIPGTDADIYFCLVCYDHKGKLIDYFCGRKLMQWPPMGGSTAVAISDEREESREPTLALFDAVGFQGLGSMEYKKEPVTGKLYIMEPTVGRNDFQSGIAVAGKVNLTRLACLDALAERIKIINSRRPSAWVCEPSLYYGLKYGLRHGDWSLLQFLRFIFRKTGFAYADYRDMAPLIELIIKKFQRLLY